MSKDSLEKKKKESLQNKIAFLSVALVALTISAFSFLIIVRVFKSQEEFNLSDAVLNSILMRTIIVSTILMVLAFLLAILFSKKVAKPHILETMSISAQKERMATELSIAANIQTDTLPTDFPLFPEHKEFEVYASMDTAREVGGDFYDVFLIDDDHLALVVGDVSDKGVPAALFMMITKTLIKTRTLSGGSPAEILTEVNNQLTDAHTGEMFVTVWLGILTLSTGQLISANAGHENPVLRRESEDYSQQISPHGLVLGSIKGMSYKDEETVLAPGDIYFVYTDGIHDATDSNGNRWGIERMLEAMNRHREKSPTELLPAIKAEVDAYVGEASQFDDMTMLAVEYVGFAN